MTCKKCEKTGLSILLVRPTAVATDPEIAPQGVAALDTHPGTVKAFALPDLKAKTKYALRLLRREGYVYVFFPDEKPTGQIKPWRAYRVYDRAALIPEGEFVFQSSEFACDKKITHPHDVRTICIAEPERIARVWIGFSMNWWSDAIKAQVMENPKAAGMVEVNLTGAPPAHGFAAEAELLKQHVADYALQSLAHGGLTEDATPFYPPGDVSASHAARAMAAVMQKQNQGGKGQPMVVAIPDPVGLAADLNGIRMARDKVLKEALANSQDARALTSDATLHGLEEALRAAAIPRAKREADGSTSQSTWNEIKDTRFYREGGYGWEPASDGSKAADGSPNGRIVGPLDHRRERRVELRGKYLGDGDWHRIGSQLDHARRKMLVAKARLRLEKDAETLAAYEADWLQAMMLPATLQYFGRHFDENDPGQRLAPTRPGEIYARESSLVHFPQPLSKQSHYAAYLAHLMDKPITDKQVVVLRAMFGNQKAVLEQVNDLLLGNANRANDKNMRDKTYELLKGLINTETGRNKFGWMTNAVAMLAGSHHMALGAAALLLLRGNPQKAATYFNKLPQLGLAHNTLLMAIEASVNKGELNLPILVQRELTPEQAVQRLKAAPEGQYSQRDRTAFNKNEKRVLVLELSDLNSESQALTQRPGELPRMRGHAPGAKSTKAFEALKARAETLNAVKTTELGARKVQAYRKIEAANLVAEAHMDQRLGVGGMVVQAIGLWQAGPALWKELNGPGGEKLRDAALSVADGASGFIGAAADTLAGAHKAALMKQVAGKHLIQMSTRLAVLKTVAAVSGVAGGALNAVMSAYSAGEAKANNDELAYIGYRTAQWMFIGTSFTSAYGAADAATSQAVSRFIARRVLLRAAGAVTAEVLAASVGVVVGVVSGVGLVLLIAGIGATVFAIVTTRTELQRWAARSYFGKDSTVDAPRFATAQEEDAALEQALQPPVVEAPAPAEPAADDRRFRPNGSFGIYG